MVGGHNSVIQLSTRASGGERDSWMATIIEYTEGYHEAQQASSGATHPWDEEYHEWRKERDEHVRAEYSDWLEWRDIE